MCKALNELPTESGIEAVDKFAMSNLDNVRSKTGFMVRQLLVKDTMLFIAYLVKTVKPSSGLKLCRPPR